MNSARRMTYAVATGLAVCSCGGAMPSMVGPSSQGSASAAPDWSHLETTCHVDRPGVPDYGGRGPEDANCPFVVGVLTIDGSGTYRGHPLSDYSITGEGADRSLTDFTARADTACTQGYQRACLAARRVKVQQKLNEARTTGGQITAVRNELNLARMASNVDEIEAHADAALAAIKAVADKAGAEQKAADDRKAATEATFGACKANLSQCEKDCSASANSDRCWALALIVGDGDAPGLTPNGGRARQLATRSCTAGNERGCKALAEINDADADCSDEPTCKARCDAGFGNACMALGQQYAVGNPGFQKSLATANALYQKGCDADSPRACFKIAAAHIEGVGVPKDVQAGRAPLVKACDLGEMLACQAYCEMLGLNRAGEERCQGPMPHGVPRSAPSSAVAPAAAASSAAADPTWCSPLPRDQAQTLMMRVQTLVVLSDWRGLSALILFPLQTPIGAISDAATFLAKAPLIFTPPIRTAIENNHGIGCAKGLVMLGTGILLAHADANGRAGLVTVNNPPVTVTKARR